MIRTENYMAKKADEIIHTVKITYKLFRIRNTDGALVLKGQNQSFQRLIDKNIDENKPYDQGDSFLVRKVVSIVNEEPIMKLHVPKKRKSKR